MNSEMKKYLDSLSPLEHLILKECLDQYIVKENDEKIPNHVNADHVIVRCPKCGSIHFVKNGFDYNHKQKYRCKDCHTVFSSTTGTMFSHSTTSFDTWKTFITGELNGLTLQQQSEATGLSVTTCFHMRHKLYAASSFIQEDVVLSGNIEFDPSYTKINLKGTKPSSMPRASKHRGKHKASTYSQNMRGISGHKVCIITGIDEHDHILFKIGGLGSESIPMFNQYKDRFKENSLLISDAKQAIIGFAMQNGLRSDSIPTYGDKKVYTTPLGNSLGSINELHSEIKNLIRKKHGISTRHLQGYLDWFVFCKNLKYRYEQNERKYEAYAETMMEQVPFTNEKVCRKEMPVSLYQAYGSYHYGIYANVN